VKCQKKMGRGKKKNTMLLVSAFIRLSSAFFVNGHVLKSNENRKLNWEILVPVAKNITNDAWYTDYDANEIPSTLESVYADRADSFRKRDLCYNETDGTYRRSNCPKELNCSHLNSTTLGPAKLCINRVPTYNGTWFAIIQKCIPKWENCDKCSCGKMSKDGRFGVCEFVSDCSSDDDRIQVDCTNPSQVTVMGKYTFNYGTGDGSTMGTLQLNAADAAATQKVNEVPNNNAAADVNKAAAGANKAARHRRIR